MPIYVTIKGMTLTGRLSKHWMTKKEFTEFTTEEIIAIFAKDFRAFLEDFLGVSEETNSEVLAQLLKTLIIKLEWRDADERTT